MEIVGEAILSSALELLFDKLGSSELLKFARQENVIGELDNWRDELLIIDEVLDDAEEKQITRKPVKKWLNDLRDLAYDMEDVLDEFTTELLRRRLMAERLQAATTSKVRSLIPTCFTGFNPVGDARLNVEMGSKIKEISRRLDNISSRQAKLGLKMDLGVGHGWERFASGRRASTWERPPTTSLINEAVQGRDKERKDIVDLLLKDEAGESNFGVLPIVGIGGTGKTTLAQLVCKDEGIMKHFDPIAWVCISEESDVVKISEGILRALPHNESTDLKDFNKVQQTLVEILNQKKFLLVLDDVWNIKKDEQWNILQTPFKYGEKGSKIIITTRDANVARTMRAYDSRYTLQPLSDDDCWSLFVKHACETENIPVRRNLELREKVTKWCGGLPLAAKVLGGLLRSKLHDHTWEDILRSQIWNLLSEKHDILQVLRLSYYHLPSHLKRCFGYCAMFPKDHEFEKKELILLWMAEGFIHQPEGGKHQMEDLGANYFDELLSRSFFQSSSKDKSRFTMHDLISHLARDIAQELCFNLEDSERENDKLCIVSERTRHSSFIRSKSDVLKRFEVFNKMEHLRTLVALPISMKDEKFFLTTKVFDDLLPKLRYLRVLSLSGYEITELPNSIGDLKLLRYLNLSYTAVKWLPESVSCLYNLQTLILSGCIKLSRLPMNIGNLINLRHLNIEGSIQLKQMPPRVGDLINLQTLSKFIVGKQKRSGIKELKNLLNLRGNLVIADLHNIMNTRDAKEVHLKGRHDIEQLLMKWSNDFGDSRNESNELEVFKFLQPPDSLKTLVVSCYGGLTFPNWVRDHSFSKMENLRLKSCKKCAQLPPIGRLPLLKYLHIEGMDEIVCIGDEFYGEVENPFPSLQSLRFDNMPKWKEWKERESLFPCLGKLIIKKCPELINLPSQLLSLVKILHIDECQKLEMNKYNRGLLESCVVNEPSLTLLYIGGISRPSCLWEGFAQSLTALKALKINQCDEVAFLGLESLGSLRHLEIRSCDGVVSLEEQKLPCNLRHLGVEGCSNLEKLPNGLGSLTFLTKLIISNCPKLVSFPVAGLPPGLRDLTVRDCVGLASLPDGMMNNSCALQFLSMKGCPSLRRFPQGELPTTLKCLDIIECESLESLPEGIIRDTSIGSSSTSGLERLDISECSSLESIPSEIVSSPEAFLTPNLKVLAITDCQNMKRPLSEWGLHTLTSLTLFIIRGPFPDVVSFSDDHGSQLFLPTALKELRISDFQSLKSVASMGLRNLISLEILVLSNCPKLRSVVPKEGLPPTLAELEIEDCPILGKRCLKNKGKDWLKIAHIPKVEIDGIIQ
ncbi:putative disease resistance protein At3g14460 [Vitis riparia]|uniref:putative disease resistance protein At3g14460 n=1 Tax=Vitis riparia TaxID=96939 RepID=UPI00155A200B|nr:putative disease resistance protein At3g14460 [Vitis riparia]